MIAELSKNDDKWRSLALKICGNKFLADEITQEMYIRIHKANPKKVNASYVFFVLKAAFLDHVKHERRYTSYYDKAVYPDYGVCDEKQEIIDLFNELPWFKQEILQERQHKSLREIENETGINYGYVYKTEKEAREYILNGKEKG